MIEGPYLLGIDFGTGGVRVGIFDPIFVTSMGGRNVRVGRLVGSGLRFSEAREQMPDAGGGGHRGHRRRVAEARWAWDRGER